MIMSLIIIYRINCIRRNQSVTFNLGLRVANKYGALLIKNLFYSVDVWKYFLNLLYMLRAMREPEPLHGGSWGLEHVTNLPHHPRNSFVMSMMFSSIIKKMA